MSIIPGHVATLALLPTLLLALAVGCGGPVHSEREIETTDDTLAGSAKAPDNAALAGAAESASVESVAIAPAAVSDKVGAIFAEALIPAPAGRPEFTVGDFNGDGSQDIAVAVKPARGAIEQINSPVANWIIKDVELQNAAEAMKRREPVRVGAADLLLAVIHGYGEAGWRNPEARQTFLLRNAVRTSGNDDRSGATWTMGTRPLTGLMPIPPARKVPGDVILLSRDGARGFIFWTGATYLRHPL